MAQDKSPAPGSIVRQVSTVDDADCVRDFYVRVADVAASIGQRETLGGKIVDGPRRTGDQQFVVVQDPAGAIIGPAGR